MQHAAVAPSPDDGAAILAPYGKVGATLLEARGSVTQADPAAGQVLDARPGKAPGAIAPEAEDAAELVARARHLRGRGGASAGNPHALGRGRKVRPVPHAPLLPAGRRPSRLAAPTEAAWPDGFPDLLRQTFGLTSTEVDVVRQIVECQSVRDVAEARSLSVDKVRLQVKSILAKPRGRNCRHVILNVP